MCYTYFYGLQICWLQYNHTLFTFYSNYYRGLNLSVWVQKMTQNLFKILNLNMVS